MGLLPKPADGMINESYEIFKTFRENGQERPGGRGF